MPLASLWNSVAFNDHGHLPPVPGDDLRAIGLRAPEYLAEPRMASWTAIASSSPARRKGWQWDVDGQRTRRTLGFASLGGATLDNEENYLIKKLFTALGAVQIENQARI